MAITTPDVVETRVCQKCGAEREITLFVKATKSRSGYLHTCKPCRNAERRASGQAKRAAGIVTSSTQRIKIAAQRRRLGWQHVDESPSSPELTLMRDLLADDRRSGWDFDQIYADNVRVALSTVPRRERKMAAAVLQWAEPHFRAGYARQDVCGLDPVLLDAIGGRRGDIEYV